MGSHSFQIMLTHQDSCLYFQYSRQEGQLYNNAVVAGIECVVGYQGMTVFSGAVPDSGYAIKFIPIDSASVLEEYEGKKSDTKSIGLEFHPNPFTSATRLRLIGSGKHVRGDLTIFDSAGRLVKSVKLETSTYQLGTDLRAGIYFLKLNGKPVGKVVKVR